MLEVQVQKAPTLRYTQDNKTPIAEMEVTFPGLREEDPPGTLKVVGWGNMAQDIQNSVVPGQKLVIEGRLRMNTISRNDGTKEKRAELTLSKLHTLSATTPQNEKPLDISESKMAERKQKEAMTENTSNTNVSWDSSPLIPETDDIPF